MAARAAKIEILSDDQNDDTDKDTIIGQLRDEIATKNKLLEHGQRRLIATTVYAERQHSVVKRQQETFSTLFKTSQPLYDKDPHLKLEARTLSGIINETNDDAHDYAMELLSAFRSQARIFKHAEEKSPFGQLDSFKEWATQPSTTFATLMEEKDVEKKSKAEKEKV